MIREKYNAIYEAINQLYSDKVIPTWNAYCEEHNNYDDRIEYMDSFNDLMSGREPLDIANMVSYGDFHSGDDYFCFNAYGNIKSFSYWDDEVSPVCIDESFVEYIEEYFHDVDCYLNVLLDDEDIKDAFVRYVNFEDTDFSYDEICEMIEDYYCFDNVIESDWEEVKSAVRDYLADHK